MWNFKALGWFSRFVRPEDASLGDFYQNILGLPLIRNGTMQKIDFLWAGETMVHQLIYEGRAPSQPMEQADPASAPLVPVYRANELDRLIDRLRGLGVTLTEMVDGEFGRETHVVDPSGSLVGLRESPRHPKLLHDQVAAFRRQRGEAFNPGCRAMPDGIQELGWLVRRVADLAAMESFYRDVLNVPLIGRAYGRVLLDIGDNTVLELAEGGISAAPPADRGDLSAVFILRVDNIQRFTTVAIERGVHFVHELIKWPRGSLAYVADPEGNLIGIEERHHPSQYVSNFAPFPEDIEARRRWVERAANSQPLEFAM